MKIFDLFNDKARPFLELFHKLEEKYQKRAKIVKLTLFSLFTSLALTLLVTYAISNFNSKFSVLFIRFGYTKKSLKNIPILNKKRVH